MENTLSDRAHRYLDGDLSRSALTPQEIRELQMHEATADRLQALDQSLKSPDLSGRVMSRVREEASANGTPRIHRAWAWLWSPRPVRLRPVYGLAAVVALFLAVSPGGDDPVSGTGSGETILVQFRIDFPAASSVQLAGSFTDWQPTYALHQTAAGVWSIMVPLRPGVHDYAFVVDGQWTHDPVAPVVADGFGGVNSRLLVVLSDEASQL